MFELEKITDRAFYFKSPAKVGLWKLNETDVCLIDSGSDKDAGRRILRNINEQGWNLKAIYNTHSHADHIGGSRYLQTQTGCKVYINGIERSFANNTFLEPAFLFGAYPPGDLRRKFFIAEECDVEYLTPEALPEGFEIIPLPGHYFDMVGFKTPDGVCFLADCLSSEITLEKYGICYAYDIAAYLETLEKVKTLSADHFLPAHADLTTDIAPLAELNIRKVNETAELILKLSASGISFENLLKALFDHYGLSLSFEQYALVGSTVRSYLAYLKDTGRLTVEFCDNVMLWKTV